MTKLEKMFWHASCYMMCMTKNEFNLVLKKMLVSMGEPENFLSVDKDPTWDAWYEKMKHLSIEQFIKLCTVGASLYCRSEKADLN